MNILAEARRARATHYAAMTEYLAKDTDESPFGDTEATNYKAMCVKLDEHDARIGRLEDLNDRAADAAEPVTGDDDDTAEMTAPVAVTKSGTAPLIRMSRKHEIKGTQFARFMIGAGLASKHGSVALGANYIREQLGDREVAKALESNVQAAGGALIPQSFRAEMIELLTAQAVIRSIVSVVPMPEGNLTYPRMNSGMDGGHWIGESQQLTVSQQSFDDVQLVAHQLAGAVPVNNNLIRRSPLTVEQIVRTDILKQLRLKEDLTLITATAQTGYAPNGLVGLTNNAVGAVTFTNLASVNNFLLTAELTLQAQNIDTQGAVWIFHPSFKSYLGMLTDSTGRYFFADELARGTLHGYAYKLTTQLPTNLGLAGNETQIFFVQGSELIFADTLDMIADSSSEATYWDGTEWVSAYTQDRTIFRAIEQIDFNVKHPAAIYVATATGASPSFWTGQNAGAPWTTQAAETTPSFAQSANPTTTPPAGT